MQSSNPSKVGGRHIGGGVNDVDATGTFFEQLLIPASTE